MRRRRFKEWEVLDTLIIQGVVIKCYRCPEIIRRGKDAQREHLHELGLDGKDEPVNCRYSHKQCHKVITDGLPHTSVGSSKQRIAKTRRLTAAREEKERLREIRVYSPFEPPETAKRTKQKIKSRGFQTNRDSDWKKPMRGPAVRRNT